VPFSSGSVLFASEAAADDKKDLEEKAAGGIHLPRSQLIILICAAAAISLAMGFLLRSWNEEKVHGNRADSDHTVLAASRPVAKSASPSVHSDAEILSQLVEQARKGNATAQYSLGRRYNLGDGVKQDYTEAARWFSRAADQGYVSAQGALGDYYNYGRGVPVDLSKAYFWSYLAFAGGDEVSKLRLGRLAGQLPHSQIVTVQQQAESWFHQHPAPSQTQ
jgi:TPR repeat protein